MKTKKNNSKYSAEDEPQLVLGEITSVQPPNTENTYLTDLSSEEDNWLVNYVKQSPSLPSESQNIITHLPENVLRPNDRATRAITSHNIINQGKQKLNIGPHDGDSPIITTLSLTLNPNFINQLVESGYMAKEDAANYTHFDNSVMTAICSLWKEVEDEEKKVVPLQTIYRFMAGFGNSHHPTPSQIQEVKDSLSKLNMIQIKMDLLKERKEDKLPIPSELLNRLVIQESLLSIRIISAYFVNGNETTVVEMLSKPPLLNLAEARGEVVIFNKKVYSTPINKTATVIALQDFLIYKISETSCESLKKVEIYFEDIFTNLPYPKSENKNTVKSFRSKVYENTLKILDYWKGIAYIKDFSVEGKGKIKYYKLVIMT